MAAGTTCADAVAARRAAGRRPKAIVVVRDADGRLRDLDWAPEAESRSSRSRWPRPDGLNVLRHSTAHVLAQAVQDLFPEAKLGIGPPIENGFYYDFAVAKPFQPEDLARLEKRMQEIIKAGQRFRRRRFDSAWTRPRRSWPTSRSSWSWSTSRVAMLGQPRGDGGRRRRADHLRQPRRRRPARSAGATCAAARTCRPPGLIGAFKLMRTAAAYWRGSEENPQLQRVYGTAWPTRDELKAYLKLLEEAARRDHRKLGRRPRPVQLPRRDRLRAWRSSTPRAASSAGRWRTTRGAATRRPATSSSTPRTSPRGSCSRPPATSTGTPTPCSRRCSWRARNYYLKPMNCPIHNLIFRSRGRSYRELPLRLFEFGTVYRYEKSGVVHGLTRVRGHDPGRRAHLLHQGADGRRAGKSLLRFVLDLLRDYGLDDFYLELSTKDPEKFVGSDEDWEEATETLRSAAEASGLDLVPDPGGAAFYGPKISVQAKDAIGRTWQMSTIQVDFNLPERFELEYQAADGTRQRPVMIHRALFGSIERFFGVLTEHYAGAFPAWLAPVQVVGIPIRDDHQPLPGGLRRAAAAARASGPRSTAPTTGCRRRSAPPSSRRSRSW